MHLPLRILGHLAGHHGAGVAADLLRHHGAKPWRSTANAAGLHPGGVGAWRIREPSRRAPLSKGPTAFSSWSLRRELEQHSSASIPSTAGGVFFAGFITGRVTSIPLAGPAASSGLRGQARADNCYIHSLASFIYRWLMVRPMGRGIRLREGAVSTGRAPHSLLFSTKRECAAPGGREKIAFGRNFACVLKVAVRGLARDAPAGSPRVSPRRSTVVLEH